MKDILVPWSLPLVRGRFLTRLHRFGALCQVQGEEVLVHVPATGRMRELLITGVPVGLRPAPPSAQNRKTAWTLVLVRHRGLWVHVDSTGPTRILPALLRRGLLEEFCGYTGILPEPRIPAPAGGTTAVGATVAGARPGDASKGEGRLDFLLTASGRPPYWVEAKSVTLVRGDTALFPDAPTPRGTRHLRELARLKGEGAEAAAVFVIQRQDASQLRPNVATDPNFAAALRKAEAAGVTLVAVTTEVKWTGLAAGRRVPVLTGG